MTEETPGVRFDIERDTRIGLPEAVFCAGKPRAALEGLFRRFADPAEKPILFTRLEESVFAALPESLAEMQALPEATLDTPFQTAALTVLALCAYAADRQIGQDMLNWLRGPRPLNGQDISFLNDRFRDGKTYLPFTYFAGSTPDNNYTPTRPYTIRVESNHVSGEEQGYMKLFIPCGGADDPRPINSASEAEMGNGSFGSNICSLASARPSPPILGRKPGRETAEDLDHSG